jgi:diguanylate cyclase (GGDEF)-like protein
MDALRAARKLIPAPDALDSIRRIARSLYLAAAGSGFDTLAEAARAVEMANGPGLASGVDRLVAELGRVPGVANEDMPGILIVEADLQMSKLLETILAGTDRRVYVAKSVAEAQGLVQEKSIALVVLDLSLPDEDGRNLLMVLRERAATAWLPVIVLSGLSGPLPKAECYALGADAFFEKPIAPEVLKAAISVRMHRSLETRREARQDPLTGLPNRAAFRENFRSLVSLSARRREPIALGLLDFDGLQLINGTFGHITGDAVLRRAAETLSKSLRQSDLPARWGGDEFAVLMPGTSLDGARRAMGKALQVLRQDVFRAQNGKVVPLSFSAGVVPVPGKAKLEEVMAEADRYLYLAKASGRRRLVTEKDKNRLAVPSHRILVLEEDALISQMLKDSLAREGLEVVHCDNGMLALQYVTNNLFTLCILDVDGASREGQALLHEIHRRGSERARILMLASPGQENSLAFGFQIGVDDYLVKPFPRLIS